VATAKRLYVDPGALLKLYLHEPESRAMTTWRSGVSAPLLVTHQGRVELGNGIALAAHLGYLTEPVYLDALDDDFASGRYRQADLLWRSALKLASELSRAHSRTLGTRSLDVLHVASAIELRQTHFVTFDHRQSALALAAGLKVLTP